MFGRSILSPEMDCHVDDTKVDIILKSRDTFYGRRLPLHVRRHITKMAATELSGSLFSKVLDLRSRHKQRAFFLNTNLLYSRVVLL